MAQPGRIIFRVFLVFLLAFFCGAAGLRAASIQVISVQTSYSFSGSCLDCTGTGTGTLVLQNYNPGDPLTTDNFVSFDYQSDLMQLSLFGVGPGAGQIDGITGSLPGALPGFSGSTIDLTSQGGILVFEAVSSGSWCSGISGCNLDFGVNGIWAAAPVNGVPEPGTMGLMLAGLGALALCRRAGRA